MKGNSHKKRTFIDKFARKYYCQHARLNSLRSDKKLAKRQEREFNKKLCKNYWQTINYMV
jgi:hypothetical protein